MAAKICSSGLGIGDLIDVIDLLKKCGFQEKKWQDLGLRLGLLKNTLEAIEECQGDVYHYMRECLSQWLRRVDNVDKRGGANWDSLLGALRSMNQIGVAEKLEYRVLVTNIFNNRHTVLSQSLCDPVSIAWFLYGERMLTQEAVSRVVSASPSIPNQREALLTAVKEAVQTDPNSLHTFANVLCTISTNVSLGQTILDDISKYVHFTTEADLAPKNIGDHDLPVVLQDSASSDETKIKQSVQVPVSEDLLRNFKSMRSSYGRMFYNVGKIIKQRPFLQEIKEFLSFCTCIPVRAKVVQCSDISSILHLIQDECSLTDIDLLHCLVEEMEITEATRYIETYRTQLKEFCESLSISLCLKERFASIPHLHCQTVTFVFDWKPEEHLLKDIKELLSKVSGKLLRIEFIEPFNSICVTCSFPFSDFGFTVLRMIENIHILMGQGLKKLTIGNLTLWRRQDVRQKELKEKDQDTLQNIISYIILEDAIKKIRKKLLVHEETKLTQELSTVKKENQDLSKKLGILKQGILHIHTLTHTDTDRVIRGIKFQVDKLKLDLCYFEPGTFHSLSVVELEHMGIVDDKELVENKKLKEKLQESNKLLNTRIRQHKKLKGIKISLSYLIPGFSGSSFLELGSHLQVKHVFSPDEVMLFVHSLLTRVGLGWCISKPSLIQPLTSFKDKFEENDFKVIQMRCFIQRVYYEFDDESLRSSFLQSICSVCRINSKCYSDSYELFQYIENTEYIHTRDETGLFFIFAALESDAEYSKVLSFAKEHIIAVCPLTVQILVNERSILFNEQSMMWFEEYKYDLQHVISKLSKRVRMTYKDMPDIPSGDFFSPWPKVDRTPCVTLALVTQDDDFSHRTLRKSEDDIPRHKDTVTYEEVFARKLSQRALILISGHPGAGKTVLLTKVAKDWARGQCLRDVNLLLHISLRELARKSVFPLLEDAIILCLLDKDKVHELAKVIDEVNGEGICFAFDGLDEYPKHNDPSDVIMKIIRKEFLPLATVIVSSRPTAYSCVPVQSRDLHVEIVGFMPEQIEEYVTHYYESYNMPCEAQDLLSYLDSHPNVKDMCYLPLHLAMILYINQFKGNNPLPETETEIYTQFIAHSIIRYIKREKAVDYINIRNFKDIERELKEEGQDELDLFHTICMIAFETKLVSHLIFSDRYLIDSFPDHFSSRSNRKKLSKTGLGILSSYTKKIQTGEEPQYSFQHLTVQEFLGAYYLSRVSSEKCLEYIALHGTSSDLRQFWKFFFGLTKYNPSSPAYFNRILAANNTQRSETLFLAHCLFEAQKSEYSTQNCRAFLASRNGKVDVSNIILNSPDCAAIGYSVSQCPLDLRELVMNYCQVGPGGIRAMNDQMDQLKAVFTNAINMQVESEGGSPLTGLLEKMPRLTELRLYGNELGNQRLLELQLVISPMTNLGILVLTKNNLGPKSGEAIGKVICNLRSLIQFHASYNPIGTEGLEGLLPGLLNCKQLQKLELCDCQLSSKSGQLFSEIISHLSNLKQLELYRNELGDDGIEDMIESLKVAPNLKQLNFTLNGITDRGGCRLAELAEVAPSLQLMRLFYNEVSDVTRKAFYDAAQRRAQQELNEIRYAI